jgi:hypothetical protein
MAYEKYFGITHRVIKWRDLNWLERLLAKGADNSEYLKRLYVLYYSLSNHKYYKKGLEMIDEFIGKHDELQALPKRQLARDMIYCLHRWGFRYEEYRIFDLWNKSTACRNNYISEKLRLYYTDIIQGTDIQNLFEDKVKCYEMFRDFFGREVIACRSAVDWTSFKDFARKHKRVFCKPMRGLQGRGAQLLNIEDDEQAGSYFNQLIQNGAFIAEELIQQGHELSLFHPQSINTVRVSTFNIKGQILVNFVFLRMGKGKSVVDNGAAGGLFVRVDYETGITTSGARTEYSNAIYYQHPDTNVQIIGYQLPQWNQLKSLVNALASKVSDVLVGWDLAYSNKGWVMVEGNYDGGMIIAQVIDDGLKPLINSRMDEFFVSKNK